MIKLEKLRTFILSTILALSFSTFSFADERPLIESPFVNMDGDIAYSKGERFEVVLRALKFLGRPYVRGGESDEGMDCSGFVRLAFGDNVELPRTAKEMSDEGVPVKARDLQPGDLVFFNTARRAFSHVGIYLADGFFLHAPRTGSVVRIESMDSGYWTQRFNGARRLIFR